VSGWLSSAASPVASLRVLSRPQVAALLPPILEQIDIVERTYLAVAGGDVELPPKPGIHPRPDAFIHAMPAYLRHEDVAAIKWVSGYLQNAARGLPYISGVIVVNDPETGVPLAILDAAEITAARTAAASGLCIRRWAPAGWSAAILGLGEQGAYHLRVLRALEPAVRVRAYDPDPARVARFEGEVEPAATAREAVEGATVVITAAPIVDRPQPAMSADWLPKDYLLLPLDFNAYVQPGPIERAELFAVDDVAQFEYYRRQGYFAGWPEPDASVGTALQEGRQGAPVACVNLGIGALDAAFAAAVLRRAEHDGVGTSVEV
jgi:ornithine cyclodeaminase/alanine dehydrogenase-like protein (mu-crystallin family)